MDSSSSDEAETSPVTVVLNYHFIDGTDEPVSFHTLPIHWSHSGGDESKDEMYLHGSADLEKIYLPVVAWRFELSNLNPEIAVLSKHGDWIVIQKPRKSYEGIIRSVLIALQCMCYARRNPEASGRAVLEHLSKIFSMYDERPSKSDLVEQRSLISEAYKRDTALAKSKFIAEFLEEKPTLFDEDIQATTKPGFIVDDADDYIDFEDESNDDGVDDDDDEEDNLFDSVCAICDNGGELLCCEGRCLRSFHPTVEDGEDSTCESLGYTREEVNMMPSFLCKNCQYKQHQCFACGKLGSSDKSLGAEVFPCVSATCGQFYHPRCVAKLIYQDNRVSAEELEKTISLGESFTCPIHKCFKCKQGENKKDSEMRFAVCRRCPKSYHRKCLPSNIRFEKVEKDEEDIEDEEELETRAWEGLLPNRILIYCTEHEIDEAIGTPIRNHVRFPDDKKKTIMKKKTTSEVKKRGLTSESNVVRDSSLLKKRKLNSEGLDIGKTTLSKHKTNWGENLGGNKTTAKVPTGLNVSGKVMNKTLRKGFLTSEEKDNSLGNRLFEYVKGHGSVKFGKKDELDDIELNSEKIGKYSPTTKTSSVVASLDPARERRLNALMNDAASSITLEKVIEKHTVPSTHKSSNKYAVEKSITQGKVEGSVEAIRTALKKLKEGCSIEDAEAVCAPEIISQIFKWKNKLKVYLAPFLHGMRYTSYGRHFTKPEKLEKVADKLLPYVQNGDTVVDLCCGANYFSIAMKRKLEETGKKCHFKNFDFIQPKNDFCFEKRDYLTLQRHELPDRNKLIMGLNPPFGVHAALAKQFISKALEFNPKLLILIVPPEAKNLPYDLIWEDERLLSGKSFYLPGSVDVNDRQMDQWNLTAPPLFLWSHPDWSEMHRAIAQKAGHAHVTQGPGNDVHPESLGYSVENKDQNLIVTNSYSTPIGTSSDSVGGQDAGKGHEEGFPKGNDGQGYPANSGQQKISGRQQGGGRKKNGRDVVVLPTRNRDGDNISIENQKRRSLSNEPKLRPDQHPSHSNSSAHFETVSNRTLASIPDETNRNVMTNEDPYFSRHRNGRDVVVLPTRNRDGDNISIENQKRRSLSNEPKLRPDQHPSHSNSSVRDVVVLPTRNRDGDNISIENQKRRSLSNEPKLRPDQHPSHSNSSVRDVVVLPTRNRDGDNISIENQKRRSLSNEPKLRPDQHPSHSNSSAHFETVSNRTLASIPDETNRNVMTNEDPYFSRHRTPSSVSPSSNYTDANVEGPETGYRRDRLDRLDSLEQRYSGGLDEINARLYGNQDSDMHRSMGLGRSTFPQTHAHAQLGSAGYPPDRMNTSVTARYQLPLDGSSVYGTPPAVGYGMHAPGTQPVFGYGMNASGTPPVFGGLYSSSMYGPGAPRPPVDPRVLHGYAQGPHPYYMNRHSAGFLPE